MSPTQCGPAWDGIDFSSCFQERILHYLAPLSLMAGSALVLLLTTLYKHFRPGKTPRIDELTSATDSLATRTSTGKPSLSGIEERIILRTVSDSLEKSFQHVGGRKVFARPWTASERAMAWVGVLGGLAVLGVQVAITILDAREAHVTLWARAALQAYLCVLAMVPLLPLRRFLPSTTSTHFSTLLVTSYGYEVFIFRSTVLSSTHMDTFAISNSLRMLEIARFAVHTAWLIGYISLPYRSDLDGVLSGYKAGDGDGAGYAESLVDGRSFVVRKNPAEATSMLSRGFYNHMIPLLLKHYRQPFELKDVPALREDDSAAVALANWRLAKGSRKSTEKPTKLVFRLLWHFRREFWRQAIWSVLGVAFSFFPPVGLQYLLRFVADRKAAGAAADEKTPTHVAVLYVGMMVAGQILRSIAYGQALDTGRRICIRTRAILVADIFAKALRRRDESGSTVAASSSGGKDEPTEKSDKEGEKAAPAGQEASPSANITNLIGVDAFYIAELSGYLFYYVSCPVNIIASVVLLYRLLGVSSVAGVVLIIVLTPVQALITRAFALLQKKLLKATDLRLEVATEMLGAIKTVKFCAWEDQVLHRMQLSRDNELRVLRHKQFVRAGANILTQLMPPLVTVVTFYFYTIVYGNPLDASTAFTALALFGTLRYPLSLLLETTTAVTNAYVSCQRLDAFLAGPETKKYEQLSVATASGEPVVGFRGATVTHATEAAIKDAAFRDDLGEEPQAIFKLANIDLTFPLGELSIITGPVGSGKTTLLSSLLGETELLDGQIFMPSDNGTKTECPVGSDGFTSGVAYCSQAPWLLSATIRENIVFGEAWDKKRYDQVVEACALERDFDIFEHRDATQVGEKGTTCSGGQKARIALARAVYSKARIVLLDDVLSAVDASVARHLYRKCLQGNLMAGRTVILVSHAIGLVLPGAAFAVVLDAGNVVAAGPPKDLHNAGHFSAEDLEDDGEDDVAHAATNEEGKPVTLELLADPNPEEAKDRKMAAVTSVASHTEDKRDNLIAAEKQEQGRVALSTYMLYFKSLGGLWFWVLIVVLFLGAQGAQVETNAWIRTWANASDRAASVLVKRTVQKLFLVPQMTHDQALGVTTHVAPWLHTAGMPTSETAWYLEVYVAINVLFALLVGARTVWLFQGALHASRTLYERLLKRILGAKMRFFDSTPSGQILNRLSNDIQTVDQVCSDVMLLFWINVISTVAVLLVIIYATPAFTYTAAFVCAVFAIVGALYNVTSREIKRVDSVTKSPVLVGFSEALNGMSTIRAYADAARFTESMFNALNTNIRAFHLLWQANRVLAAYCDIASCLITIFACLFVLLNKDLDAGAAGLSLSYALTFMDFVLWIIRLWAANEQNMNSVERIGEYLELEAEEESHARGKEPPAYWPTKTAGIVVQDLTCSYAPELEPVLRGASFEVKAGERVGICGRTGSGKSTLALSFFRFIEALSGQILIDGLDIATLSLSTLRQRLTILPQEAQLFSGTVRENLDVFQEHDDADLWEALRNVGMASRNTPATSRIQSRVASRAQSRVPSVHEGSGDESEGETATAWEERIMIKSLDEPVAKGGSNYSQGQRQLLALARGLLKLKNSSILFLDESTANLDHATDEQIQHVLRENLVGTTMLIIAHRLRTIVDCDKILVLDHGRVLEFDTPQNLLAREDSSFRDLCRRSGEEGALLALAEKAGRAREM